MSEEILQKDGKPFGSIQTAKMVFAKKGLDDSKWLIKEVEGGFVIAPRSGNMPEPVVVRSDGSIEYGDYPVIRLGPAGKGEIKRVPVSVNGATLLLARNKDLCIPVSYVRVLENAIEEVYPEVDEVSAGEPFVPTERQRYPFTFIRNGSKAEFEKMLVKGDAKPSN